MHVHILGICGTFMGGVAVLAKQMGHHVTGSDVNVYPPMSTQLEEQGIELVEGFAPEQLDPLPDYIVVGNVMKRGMPVIEHLLNEKIPFVSGPQWLAENVLTSRRVLAVAGTHGKTTTSFMLTWILEFAGLKPGYLIGGVAKIFSASAHLGKDPFFVIEADEYDSAFFDKRSKFIHYKPEVTILNNLEFDHADIFPDLAAIEQQFHYMLRTVPSEGLIIKPEKNENIERVLQRGCWTPLQSIGIDAGDWSIGEHSADGSTFTVMQDGNKLGEIKWSLMGEHNMQNALAAIAAANHVGVDADVIFDALSQFAGVKRRMEIRGKVNDVTVYDDFAHHPTAIATTIKGLRNNVSQQPIIAVLECASFTMREGYHGMSLASSLAQADKVFLLKPSADWGLNELAQSCHQPCEVCESVDEIIEKLCDQAEPQQHILIMSNRGFAGIHEKLLQALEHHVPID